MGKRALVLSGGGARGAYQAGVLKGLAEILGPQTSQPPFEIVAGVSAGAINAVHLAANADDIHTCVPKLTELWSNLTADKVFRTDLPSLGSIGLRWLADLSFGSMHKHLSARSLLDTSPLRTFLSEQIDFSKVKTNIAAGFLEAIAITATDYGSSNSITFIDGREPLAMWTRNRRLSEKADIDVDHIMASAAIPLFFPPIGVGKRFFGDGCLRNLAPLSPAIHLGADKLFVVSIRKQHSTPANPSADEVTAFRPSIARVLSVLLNAVFMDATEADIERLSRINQTVKKILDLGGKIGEREVQDGIYLRPIEFLWIQPSEDLGALARQEAHRLPRMIRYLLGGLGSIDEASEIISYLLFDPKFCRLLIDMGYRDALARRAEIERFFDPA